MKTHGIALTHRDGQLRDSVVEHDIDLKQLIERATSDAVHETFKALRKALLKEHGLPVGNMNVEIEADETTGKFTIKLTGEIKIP